jgi:hypothetical protein
VRGVSGLPARTRGRSFFDRAEGFQSAEGKAG